MTLQSTLKTLEKLRAEAQAVRDRQDARNPGVYDYWAGREAALADAIAELTRGVRPITREEAGWPERWNLGAQLEHDHAKHRTEESNLLEDR